MPEPEIPVVGYGQDVSSDTPVHLVSGEQRVTVPASKAQDLINTGWDIEDHAVTVERAKDAAAGTLGGQALTAVENLGAGLTLGASRLALDIGGPRGYTEEAERRARVNETTAMVGQIAGAALPVVLSGGTSSGASLLSRAGGGLGLTPAGGVARLSGMVGRGAESLLAREGAGFARTMASRAAGTAVEGGIEAAIFQAADNATEASLGDLDLTAERLLAGVPQAALFGGGFGALFGGGFALPSAARAGLVARSNRKAAGLLERRAAGLADELPTARGVDEHVAPDLADAAEGGLWDKAREKAIDWSARLSGKNRADISKAWGDPKAADDAFRYSEKLDTDVERTAEAVQKIIDTDAIGKALAAGELKSVNVAKSIRRGDDVLGAQNNFVSGLKREVKFGQSDLAKYNLGEGFSRDTREAFRSFEKEMRAAGRSDDVLANQYLALENLKRSADSIVKDARKFGNKAGNKLENQQAKATQQFWEKINNPVRQHLEDAALYGQAGVAQKARNAGISEFMETLRPVNRRVVRDSGEQMGKEAEDFEHWSDRKMIANRSGIRSMLDNLLDGDVAFDNNQVIRHMEARSKAIKTLKELDEIPAKYADQFDAAEKAADDVLVLMREQTERLKNAQAVRRLSQSDVGTGLLQDAGKAGATLIGSVLGGVPGTLVGAGIDLLRNPYSVAQKIAGLRMIRSKLATGELRDRLAIRGLLTGTGKLAKKAQRGLTIAAATGASLSERRNKADRVIKGVEQWQAKPELLAQHVAEHVTRGMDGAAPSVSMRIAAQQQKLLQNLQSRLPRGSVSEGLGPKVKTVPHDSEVRKFLTYAAGALNPGSILESPESAVTNPEALQAVKDNWPAYYAHLRQMAIDEIGTHGTEISYSKRLQVSLMFDLPGDYALSPGFLQRQDARFKAREAEKQAEPPPPAQREAADTSASARTLSESVSENL